MAHLVLAPGDIDQDPAHGLGGGGEKMPPVVPMLLAAPDQPQPSLVDQCGRLERLPRSFLGHPRRGKFAQFLVNQWQEFLGGLSFALMHASQDARHLAHGSALCAR